MKSQDKLYEVKCLACGKQEMLKYKAYWYRKNKGTGSCRGCAPKNMNGLAKGHGWNKGITGRLSHSYGQVREGLVGADNPFYGRKHSPEAKEKMRAAKLGKRGDTANNWQGGKTREQHERQLANYKDWRKAVLLRDDYTCQFCDTRGGKLQVDHIKRFSEYPELRTELSNGRTLCYPCHRTTFVKAEMAV